MKKVLALFCMAVCFVMLVGCTKHVSDKEITIQVNEYSLTGKYTGTITDGKPNGIGFFESNNNDRIFVYEGQWENGKISGDGVLKDTKYTVNFPHVTRIGEYSGNVVDGIAEGKGSYTATNDDNLKYTYTGSWENGLFNGQGVERFEDESMSVRTGNFENGKFKPNKLEYIKSLGDCKGYLEFKVYEKAEEFIKLHDDLFPASDTADINEYIDETILYKSLIKNPNKYGDKLIRLSNYRIEKIYESELWGYTLTEIFADSENYDDEISCYYLGELPDIYEGTRVTIEGLPIDYSSFENTGGGTTLSYVIYGVRIKQI